MNILITNDDGIYAKGINFLIETLSKKANVYVCAPDTQKSACGQGLSVFGPLFVKEVDIKKAKKAWSLSGTPADCVKVALKSLVSVHIDLVFSGINHGANLGSDVLYSGTFGGASEAALMGIPSVAISLDNHSPDADFSLCKPAIEKVLAYMKKTGIKENLFLNVNIPQLPEGQIHGTKVARLGSRKYKEDFIERKTPHGKTYFWYSGVPILGENPEGTDIHAIENGYISITPIKHDPTDYTALDTVSDILE